MPIGRGRHALYCEPGDDPTPMDKVPRGGLWQRLAAQFSAVIAAVEREQDEHAPHGRSRDAQQGQPAGLWVRLRRRSLAWVAEKIAEQRLLWRLRNCSEVRVFVPAGLQPDEALATIRGNLKSDFDRHRWWMVVDGIGGILSVALMFIPGPNLIGYYFAFRIVGHYLSLRGARHGLSQVRWHVEPSGVLAELQAAADLPQVERERRVQGVADRLGLRRFPRFYRRAAGPA